MKLLTKKITANAKILGDDKEVETTEWVICHCSKLCAWTSKVDNIKVSLILVICKSNNRMK